jgi:hypothetical protein
MPKPTSTSANRYESNTRTRRHIRGTTDWTVLIVAAASLLAAGCTREQPEDTKAPEAPIPFAADVTRQLLAADAPARVTMISKGIKVRVALSPDLKDKVGLGDTVFIFARADQGPRMPLAILRVQVKDLPVAVSLDDSMAMAPNLRISDFPRVVVGARVSRTGSANPQAGDVEGYGPVVETNTNSPIQVVINRVVDSSAAATPPTTATSTPAGHPDSGTRLKLEIPVQVSEKWKSVGLAVTGADGKTTIARVNLGGVFADPHKLFLLRAVAFAPSFEASEGRVTSRSNQLENPAVLVHLISKDRIVAEGWIFQKFPQFNTFSSDQIKVALTGAYASDAN